MSKKRYFDTKFWSDSWIVDELNQLDRYLFMYLMLNEKTNIAGVYELPLRTISFETGIDSRDLAAMLKRLEPKVFYRDGWVVLTNGIKHQNYGNSKIKEGIRRELCNAPKQLLVLVNLPEDLNIDLTCPVEDKTGVKDESSMSHEDTSHLIESNRIELNRIKSKPNASDDAGIKKTFNKKTYREAVQADEALVKKESQAKARPKGYQTFAQAGELLKTRKFK